MYRMPFIESGARMNMKQVGVQQPQSEEGGWAFSANDFFVVIPSSFVIWYIRCKLMYSEAHIYFLEGSVQC